MIPPVPLAPLQPLLALAVRAVRRRHPAIFDRLSGFGRRTLRVEPTDLPVAFLLHLDPPGARLVAVRPGAAGDADAVVRGRFAALLELLEGRGDGDALFFARELAIEGDTELVLAMRNALDDAEIDLAADVLAAMGPAGPLLRRALSHGLGVVIGLAEAPGRVSARFLGPGLERLDGVARGARALRDRLAAPAPGLGLEER